jgi:hypothetical protein
MLTRREKVLYHQIHPLKLAVDVTSSVVSGWLCWRHQFLPAVAVGFLPSIVASAFMVAAMDFTRQRDSRLGRYVAVHMTRTAEGVRLGGQLVMWAAAWLRRPWLIAAGFLIVVLGWTSSLPRWRRSITAVKGA